MVSRSQIYNFLLIKKAVSYKLLVNVKNGTDKKHVLICNLCNYITKTVAQPNYYYIFFTEMTSKVLYYSSYII